MNAAATKLPLELGAIHFVGIGGIGMSGIAEVLLNLRQNHPRQYKFHKDSDPSLGSPLTYLVNRPNRALFFAVLIRALYALHREP